MALPINIDDLIRHGVVEGERIEYKAGYDPEPIVHSICAFANDMDNCGGGYIVIGINQKNGIPEFPVVGIDRESVDDINKDLLNKCNLIEPRYLPQTEAHEFDGKEILVIWVPGGESRPYKCPTHVYKGASKAARKESGSETAYFIRKMASTIRANSQEEKELFQLSETVPFDDRVNWNADVGDLRIGLISEYLHSVDSALYTMQGLSLQDLAENMHLLGGLKEVRKPLNVALMFFIEHPEDYFRYARIEVVDKPDPTGIGMTEKTFYGPLDRQLRDALNYIRNYILKEKVTKVDGRPEADRTMNFPYRAVEEALTNAVQHKSYQIGEPVTVTVTPEKMEILSVPGPDRSISDEDIRNLRMVSVRYRNRRIGDFLKELRLAEGRNTGIPTMVRAMERNGSEPPVFETDADRTYFKVVLPIHRDFLEAPESARNDGQVKESGKRGRSADELKDAILSLLGNGENMSAGEIAEKLGYARRSSSVSNATARLLTEGRIEYVHPENIRSRTQKFRIVNK